MMYSKVWPQGMAIEATKPQAKTADGTLSNTTPKMLAKSTSYTLNMHIKKRLNEKGQLSSSSLQFF